jgi:hypothetical protein
MARKGKFRMVKHHAAQNHRHSKQGGHGGSKSKALIKTAHTKKGRKR